MMASKRPLRFTTALFFTSLALTCVAQTSSWTLDRAITHAQPTTCKSGKGKLGLELNDIDVDEAKAAFSAQP